MAPPARGRGDLVVQARVLRERDDDGVETTPRAFLVARKTADGK
ncbi:hypothetical protein [Longimycelium tulufanense]|nr:hypothetical protein [Longimycelium tulufanense]